MIPAHKTRLLGGWFARHAEARLKATFSRVRVRGLEALREACAQGPVLVVSNHSSWWDPLVAIVLCARILKVDAYALMDAKNLRRLPFFAHVGAFGVDLDDRADGARAIRYAAGLLAAPGRLVWVFPQGRERPITERPLAFEPGAAAIARVAKKAVTVPVALRYDLGPRERPDLWIAIGGAAAGARDVEVGRAGQERAVTAELDAIDAALRSGGSDAFATWHEARTGWLGALAERLLARWTARGVLGLPAQKLDQPVLGPPREGTLVREDHASVARDEDDAAPLRPER